MIQYVIKQWKASDQPVDDNRNHVSIVGRPAGLISWLLTVLRLNPTMTLTISAEEIRLTESSFSGRKVSIVPLENVCSTYYGYHKPWKVYLFLGLSLAYPTYGIGLIIAAVLYFLNKSLTLAFIENSGVTRIISFKRSIIEGQNIDETQAAYVADLTQALIDNRKAPHRTS